MVEKRRTYLLQDPSDEDSIQFIRTAFTQFGLRPVCFHTDARARFYAERQHRILKSDSIEASFDVPLGELGSFAASMKDRFKVLGVVPCREETIEVGAELCRLLDLRWNSAETLRRFRDKFALKTYVHSRDPGVRVPECRLVVGADDVWQGPLPARFVLKPNDGYGNQRIGIFDASEREAIARHLGTGPASAWILEEFIDGPEFHIDGQIRSNGEVTVLGVFEYERASVNDYATVYRGERQCKTSHPRFNTLAEYARRLLTASGLRRCPFHLEVKVDERGPCVIDVGARFASDGGGRTLSRLHPSRPDAFAVAAYDYLFENSFATGVVDFSHYDRELTVLVYGISEECGLIDDVAGVSEVEAMPEFVTWHTKPLTGDVLRRTQELRAAPYIVELRHWGSDDDSSKLIDTVQRTIRWNQRPAAGKRLNARAARVLRRAPTRLSWLGHQARARTGLFKR